jgi:hypothetical protein
MIVAAEQEGRHRNTKQRENYRYDEYLRSSIIIFAIFAIIIRIITIITVQLEVESSPIESTAVSTQASPPSIFGQRTAQVRNHQIEKPCCHQLYPEAGLYAATPTANSPVTAPRLLSPLQTPLTTHTPHRAQTLSTSYRVLLRLRSDIYNHLLCLEYYTFWHSVHPRVCRSRLHTISHQLST